MDFRRQKYQQTNKPSKHMTCKKHPRHQQNPGVCSICLNEKLSQLSSGSYSRNRRLIADSCSSSSSSLSSLSSHYSSNASSCASPSRQGLSGPLILMRGGKDKLKKSRSTAAGGQRMKGDEKKKKRNFWSKLLRPRGKRVDEGLVQSTNLRERLAIRLH